MKNLILTLFLLWSYSLFAGTTGHLIPHNFKTIQSVRPLVPFGFVNLDEAQGQTGYSFSTVASQTITIPSGQVEFYPAPKFMNIPSPSGNTVQMIGMTPFLLWKANFPSVTVQLNKEVKEGCHSYKGTLNQPLQLDVEIPAGTQFHGLEILINGPVIQHAFVLQNQTQTLDTVPVIDVTLNICHQPDVDQDTNSPTTSCEQVITKRVKQLAKKTIFGPWLPTVATGGLGAAAGAGAVYLAGSNLPLWLVNTLGREVIKQPLLALAPVAAGVGAAAGILTFLGYEAVVITKTINAGQVLKSVKMAKQGKVKKSWLKSLDKKLKNKVTVRGWDPKKKEEIVGNALRQMDREAMLCDGSLKSKRVQKKKKKKLRHLVAKKKEIINFLAKNKQYLLGGGFGAYNGGEICPCNPTEGIYAFCPSGTGCSCCNKIGTPPGGD